jgi:hypothetical protein
MSQSPFIFLDKSSIPLAPIPLLVLPLQVYDLRHRQDNRQHQRTQTDCMPEDVFRRVVLQIDERAYEGRAVCDRNHDAYCNCADLNVRGAKLVKMAKQRGST